MSGGLKGCPLATQFELLEHVLVAVGVALAEVVEQRTALAYHLQQSAARVLVLLVSLEVLRKLLDLLSKNPNLNFRRAGVLLVGLQPSDNLGFGVRL